MGWTQPWGLVSLGWGISDQPGHRPGVAIVSQAGCRRGRKPSRTPHQTGRGDATPPRPGSRAFARLCSRRPACQVRTGMAPGAAPDHPRSRRAAPVGRPHRSRRRLLLAALQRVRNLRHRGHLKLSVQTPATDGYAAAPSRESSPAVAEVVRTHKADMLARYGHPVIVSSNEAEAVKAIDRMVRTSAPPTRPSQAYVTASLPAENRVQIPSYYAAVREAATNRQPERVKETKALTRVAALEGAPSVPTTPITPVVPRLPLDGQPKTDLVSFQTAPFPHEGRSYSDSRVLLTVPPGFDANRPAVMIVYLPRPRRDARARRPRPPEAAGPDRGVGRQRGAGRAAVRLRRPRFQSGQVLRSRRLQALPRRGRAAARASSTATRARSAPSPTCRS